MGNDGLSAADFFTNNKRVQVLLYIYENEPCTATEVYKGIDSTFAHASNIIGSLESDLVNPLVCKRKDGKRKFVSLTDEGEKLAEQFAEVADFEGDTK